MAASEEERPAVVFEYGGRFGHFLKAEASVSALTYPMPPRTALLGMMGAVLGLPKDAPQVDLKNAMLAVGGPVPQSHWHRVKLRKDPPAPLPQKVKVGTEGSSNPAPEKATLNKQEWLLNPRYRVTACLPEEYHDELVGRLRERRWRYQPCLGLSEMAARLDLIGVGTAAPLPENSEVSCSSVAPRDGTSLDGREVLNASGEEPLAILPLRMPREVSPERIFTHADYMVERAGLPIPLRAKRAYEVSTSSGSETVVFL